MTNERVLSIAWFSTGFSAGVMMGISQISAVHGAALIVLTSAGTLLSVWRINRRPRHP